MGYTLKYPGEPGDDKYMADDWYDALMVRPSDDRRVICVTETKKHAYNYVLGYYDNKRGVWVCGMNSNVILWRELPPLPMEGLKHYGQ